MFQDTPVMKCVIWKLKLNFSAFIPLSEKQLTSQHKLSIA